MVLCVGRQGLGRREMDFATDPQPTGRRDSGGIGSGLVVVVMLSACQGAQEGHQGRYICRCVLCVSWQVLGYVFMMLLIVLQVG